MSEHNPYAPPQVPLHKKLFPEMDFNTLKRLKNRSHAIKILGVLWGGLAMLGAIPAFIGLVSLLGGRWEPIFLLWLSFFGIFALASYGALVRPSWGRTWGLFVNFAYLCLMVFWSILSFVESGISVLLVFFMLIPIGFAGLFSFSEASLFGDKKYLHSDLKEEYAYRKKNGQ